MKISWSMYENFFESEFSCPCCGAADMDPYFLQTLQTIRTQLGESMNITSGFRCAASEKKKGRSGKGGHTLGQAADVGVSGAAAHLLLLLALGNEVPRIGISQKGPHGKRFIHLDTSEASDGLASPWVWSY